MFHYGCIFRWHLRKQTFTTVRVVIGRFRSILLVSFFQGPLIVVIIMIDDRENAIISWGSVNVEWQQKLKNQLKPFCVPSLQSCWCAKAKFVSGDSERHSRESLGREGLAPLLAKAASPLTNFAFAHQQDRQLRRLCVPRKPFGRQES